MSTAPDRRYSATTPSTPPPPSPPSSQTVRNIAVFGAGRVGTALGRVLVAAGYQVRIVGSGPASGISLIVDVMAPGAVATDAASAVADADIVILAVPLHRLDSIDTELLRGRVVVDVMNYWEPIDGTLADFSGAAPTSTVVSSRLSGATLVKTLNHIGYHDIEIDRRAPGASDRRALAVSGDDRRAVDLVLEMVHRIGFDAVDAGGLADSGVLEAGGPLFGVRMARADLEQHLSS
jgi:predicted dinucleotide-binding enzyme